MVPDLVAEVVESCLWVVVACKLAMQVQVSQECLQLLEAQIAAVVLVVNPKARFEVFFVLPEMLLHVQVLNLLSIVDFPEEGALVPHNQLEE